MGVDYSSNCGIGVEVEAYEEIGEYLESEEGRNVLKDNDLCWFEVGDGAYTGELNEYFIVYNKPAREIGDKWEFYERELLDVIGQIDLTSKGKMDLCNGLEVY